MASMAGWTRDRINDYYRGRAAKSLRLRLFIAIPSVVLACMLVSRILAFPLRIDDNTMEPALRKGERHWFSINALGLRQPFSLNSPANRWRADGRIQRGQVVALVQPLLAPSSRLANVFRFPIELVTFGMWKPEATRMVVRRVVALPGESVVIRDKQIFINNRLFVPDWFIAFGEAQILPERISGRDNLKEVYIPADSVFLLNDNWMVENDSRSLGPVPVWKLHGRWVPPKK
jgi:signal peptidase I